MGEDEANHLVQGDPCLATVLFSPEQRGWQLRAWEYLALISAKGAKGQAKGRGSEPDWGWEEKGSAKGKLWPKGKGGVQGKGS